MGLAFDKPPVEAGRVVLWRYGPYDKETIPAIVLKVGNETLTVGLFTDSNKTIILKSGVRHRNDPFLTRMPQHDLGCWDLCPRDRRIDTMLADYEAEDLEDRDRRLDAMLAAYEADVALSASLRGCEDDNLDVGGEDPKR